MSGWPEIAASRDGMVSNIQRVPASFRWCRKSTNINGDPASDSNRSNEPAGAASIGSVRLPQGTVPRFG